MSPRPDIVPLTSCRSKQSFSPTPLTSQPTPTHQPTPWMASTNPLHWLTGMKSANLKTLAAAIGTNSSSTKPVLIAALQTHLPIGFFPQEPGAGGPQDSGKKHDIISIDMGIRNLAYCRINLPSSWPPPNTHDSTPAMPVISEWARIAISSKTQKSSSTISNSKKKKTTTTKMKGEHGDEAIQLAEEEASATSAAKEVFDPSTFSKHAYNLISHLLNQHTTKPTQILVERQRFRSMGGSAVQEWTLRVNMFEAMLYAVLKTMAEQGQWTGSVYAVAPSKIGRFWLGDGEGLGEDAGVDEESGEVKRGKKRPSKSARTKTAKIRVVESWVEEVLCDGQGKVKPRFGLEGYARELGEAFLRKRKGERDVKVRQEDIGGTGTGKAEIGKLDDLADCILQGMAWVKWEENRQRILEVGASALSEL